MGDQAHAKIDRFFNVLDAVIDEGAHLLDRMNKTQDVIDHVTARSARKQPIDVDAREMSPTARPRRSAVRIIESIDAQTGKPMFVVTDGVARSECPTREIAERIKRAMENKP